MPNDEYLLLTAKNRLVILKHSDKFLPTFALVLEKICAVENLLTRSSVTACNIATVVNHLTSFVVIVRCG